MLGAGLSPVLAAPKHKTSPEKLAAGLPVDGDYEEREGAVSPPPLFSWEDKPPRLELFKNRVGIQPSTSALNSAASTVIEHEIGAQVLRFRGGALCTPSE